MKILKTNSETIGYKRCINFNKIELKWFFFKSNEKNFRSKTININLKNSISNNWDYPTDLYSALFCLKEDSSIDDYINFLNTLKSLNCNYIVIIVSNSISKSFILKILKTIKKLCFFDTLLLSKYNDFVLSDEFSSAVYNISIPFKAIFYNSPFEKNYSDILFFTQKKHQFIFKKHQHLFNYNPKLFSESQSHHTYFNRKLYIGPNGEVKNAPECEETFGNFNDLKSPEDLKKIIQTRGFQRYWFVHKEITDVCKDCEFRHMCVDNRLPYERKKDAWYHKIECNYNPYIAKWEGEEGYRTLAECGVISNEHEFSIDHEKIALINKELWGDE